MRVCCSRAQIFTECQSFIHSTRKWLRARRKSKRLRLFWANLRERMSKDIKSSQLKLVSHFLNSIWTKLCLCYLVTRSRNFLYWLRLDRTKTTNPSCVRARPRARRGAKSSMWSLLKPAFWTIQQINDFLFLNDWFSCNYFGGRSFYCGIPTNSVAHWKRSMLRSMARRYPPTTVQG